VRKDPAQVLSRSKETMSGEDGQLLDQPEVAEVFIDALREAFRAGVGGVHQEAALYARPWGFRLLDITAEVRLWHGGMDENVPVSVGHYVADAIPNCNATFCEEEGHLTLPHNRMKEILSTLVV
jgi:hypothetical protein